MTREKQPYLLDPKDTDSIRIKAERAKARELRKTQWWKSLLQKGKCHFCEGKFPAKELTMDHLLPLARGGKSVRSNLVPACRKCNQEKKLDSPLDSLFEKINAERNGR